MFRMMAPGAKKPLLLGKKGLFAELYYDTLANELVRLRSFSSAVPLEDYAVHVRLPDEWA